MWFEHNEELVAVRHAFYKACEELGIGPEECDKERREQLEQVFLTIFNFGERDPEVIRARAVQQMRLPPPDCSTSRKPGGCNYLTTQLGTAFAIAGQLLSD